MKHTHRLRAVLAAGIALLFLVSILLIGTTGETNASGELGLPAFSGCEAAPCIFGGDCFEYEFLGAIVQDGSAALGFRMVNTCNRGLSYVAFSLPEEVVAQDPQDGSTHVSPGGNLYRIENPTRNPFYSIKFDVIGDGIRDGDGDEFWYALPQAAYDPWQVILVAARAGQFVEQVSFTPGGCELDSDGDRVPDSVEGGDETDTDGDGIPNYLDPDDDGDTVPTIYEDPSDNCDPTDDDTDNDGIPNYLDPDDDDDGVPTKDEDPNGNGTPMDDDTDNDLIPDYLDPDDDGDGVPTACEDANCNGDPTDDDTDGDGIPDYLDPDSAVQCTQINGSHCYLPLILRRFGP